MQLVKFHELAKGTPVYINVDTVVYVMHGSAWEPSPIANQKPREIPGVILQLTGITIGVRGTIQQVIDTLNSPDWGTLPHV